MNLEERYKENYILLIGLREFVENGTMLASVNFWRDSAQNFKEMNVIDNRTDILKNNPKYASNAFLTAFVSEEFPPLEDEVKENVIEITLPIIEEMEGRETAELVKLFLIDYAVAIAKASKEDWLAFIGVKDAVSDEEEKFINRLKTLFA